MLPRALRIVNPTEYSHVLGSGSKGANRLMVTVIAVPEAGTAVSCLSPRLGLIVSKRNIPKAVDRNRLKRQLRHLFRQHLDDFPPGSAVVVRVLSQSQGKTSPELESALLETARRALRKVARNER